MPNFTHKPPEDISTFLKQLQTYIEKAYKHTDKEPLLKILRSCDCKITKIGEWGTRWGYSKARIIFFLNPEDFGLEDRIIKKNLINVSDTLLQSTDCGLEIMDVDFFPKLKPLEISIEDDLINLLRENSASANGVPLPEDLIKKGKEMSEAYLYIYFVENYFRLFIEGVQRTNEINFPREVSKTIEKNRTNESQNKFLPLRGKSDLFYCDFVQLQQIIINNWEVFKEYFPQQDQHWLRVKIEDMYRVRNLIAHCGYISQEELHMVKSNFRMIFKQLKFSPDSRIL